jgi:hypothetical protein
MTLPTLLTPEIGDLHHVQSAQVGSIVSLLGRAATIISIHLQCRNPADPI